MFLVDRDIRHQITMGRIVIDPFDDSMIQPASVDLRLDRFFRIFKPKDHHPIDPFVPQEMDEIEIPENGRFGLAPGAFCLGSTLERIEIASNMVGRLEGKSSIGRLGLTTHVTAGFFDPGFRGYATLELFNASGRPIYLYPGMKIAQMSFAATSGSAIRPYGHEDLGSKYQDQERGPKPSEYFRNDIRSAHGL